MTSLEVLGAALRLAEGRLEMLLKADLPESDHPGATEYVLAKVREALKVVPPKGSAATIDPETGNLIMTLDGLPVSDTMRQFFELLGGGIPFSGVVITRDKRIEEAEFSAAYHIAGRRYLHIKWKVEEVEMDPLSYEEL